MRKLAIVLVTFAAACGSAEDAQDLSGNTSVLIGFRDASNSNALQSSEALALAREDVVRALGGVVENHWAEIGTVSAHLSQDAIARLANDPNVEFVEPDRQVHALAITGSGEDTWGNIAVKADQVRAAGVTGAGITVCVIDTGIDPGHPEFTRTPALFGAGYDFVDNDSDPTDYGCDANGCRWGGGHGSHVSGTIAAQLGHGGTGAPDAGGIVGVAPGVTVVMYRVLDLSGSGSTSSVINAIKACQALPGRRIASLSLGSNQKSRAEQRAFDAAYQAGVLVFAAAGNDGNTRSTYPAAYASAISVAAIDANLAHASFSNANRDVELAAPGVAVLSSVPRGEGRASQVSVAAVGYASNALEYSATGSVAGTLVNCGLGDSTTSCSGAASGFVAYVDRGSIAFSEKVTNVMAQGAAAVILANNDTAAPDDVGSFTLGAAGNWIPSVSVSYNSGVAMKSALGSKASVNISASDYATWDGTSMATPHASACGALLWSAKPTMTAADVRKRLVATAVDLGAAGRDNEFGYGLVDCYQAVFGP